jgi:transcriptional repressor NrdR
LIGFEERSRLEWVTTFVKGPDFVRQTGNPIVKCQVRNVSRTQYAIRDARYEMRCPFCKEDQDRVIDSRSSDGGRVIRRRRQCLMCRRRFTTYEKIGESFKLYVVKKDNSRIPYDRDKIVSGLQKACYKRPVSAQQIQQIADKAEENIFRNFDKEVSSVFIGDSVMKQLRRVDKVAYIRFASVYRDFRDAGELIKEVSKAITEAEPISQPMLFE